VDGARGREPHTVPALAEDEGDADAIALIRQVLG
jgi:hypothetical protein